MLVDNYVYRQELDMFLMAATASIGFNDPKGVGKLNPNKKVVDLDSIHPMLRGSLGRG